MKFPNEKQKNKTKTGEYGDKNKILNDSVIREILIYLSTYSTYYSYRFNVLK